MCTTAIHSKALSLAEATALFQPFAPNDVEGHWKAVVRLQDEQIAEAARRLTPALDSMVRAAVDAHTDSDVSTTALDAVRLDALREPYAWMYLAAGLPFAERTFQAIETVRATKQAEPYRQSWRQVLLSFLRTHGTERMTSVTETMRGFVRSVLVDAAREENRWSVPRTARELRTRWHEARRYQAERVARTEIISATNKASLEGARSAQEAFGLSLQKEWLSTFDGRTRDTHSAASGQRVPMDGLFTVGGYRAEYAGDPRLPASEVINCRCTVIYVEA